MNQFLTVIFFILTATGSTAQNLLRPEWQFRTGDDLQWAAPEHQDSAWSTILAGTVWEKQGFDHYDGFAWYRQAIVVPGQLREQARKQGGLSLHLGMVDDADQCYWNGQLIGKTGDLPPQYRSAYNADRNYAISFDKIRFDQINIIAVRVYDGGGGGGLSSKNSSLRVTGSEDLLVMSMTDMPSDHLFSADGPVNLKLRLTNRYEAEMQGMLKIKVRSDFGEQVFSDEKYISVPPKNPADFFFEPGRLTPGFYQADLVFSGRMENKQMSFAIGVDPTRIHSPADRPADFEDYWLRARRELAAVSPQFRMIRQDSLCTPEREVFLVEMRSLGNVLVRGWYRRPAAPGTYPALLHVQGYRSHKKAMDDYPGNDMAVFVLNIRGHGNSRDHVNPGFPGYLLHQVGDPELYIYRGAYMDCIRAVDFLFSRPEVDTSRVAVEGGSQGGALSIATAALDQERIKLCVPHVPFLSDFRDYFQVAPWPASEFNQYVAQHPEVGWEGVLRTLSYIDIKNLASWVKAPVLMAVGLEDPTCPPHINFAPFNEIPGPKDFIVYPAAGHQLPEAYHALKFQWIRKKFGME